MLLHNHEVVFNLHTEILNIVDEFYMELSITNVRGIHTFFTDLFKIWYRSDDDHPSLAYIQRQFIALRPFFQTFQFTVSVSARSPVLLEEQDMLVSSAYIVTVQFFKVNGRSFTQIRKSSGPKNEPCGTSQVMLPILDYAPLILLN